MVAFWSVHWSVAVVKVMRMGWRRGSSCDRSQSWKFVAAWWGWTSWSSWSWQRLLMRTSTNWRGQTMTLAAISNHSTRLHDFVCWVVFGGAANSSSRRRGEILTTSRRLTRIGHSATVSGVVRVTRHWRLHSMNTCQ